MRWRWRCWKAAALPALDFRTFHPGGKLGASLAHVGDIMHRGDVLPLVAQGTSLQQAVTILSQKRFGCVGILDGEGRLSGIITDGDIARSIGRNLGGLVVDDIMTRTPKTVRAESLATAAMAILNQHNISALFVIDDTSHAVGVVHFHDLLRIGVA